MNIFTVGSIIILCAFLPVCQYTFRFDMYAISAYAFSFNEIDKRHFVAFSVEIFLRQKLPKRVFLQRQSE